MPETKDILLVFDSLLDNLELFVSQKQPVPSYLLHQLQTVREMIQLARPER
jgi:hypothetical protein